MSTPHGDALIAEAPDDTVAFAELKRRMKQAGLLEMQPRYYIVKITLTLAAFAAGWVAFVWLGDSWWQLALAVYLAFWAVQLAYIVHDASHKEITHSKRNTWIIGYGIADVLLGVSFGWWVTHHGRHHANPNHLELDPDITRRVAIFSPKHAGLRQGWKRFVVKYQHRLYFPLTTTDTLKLRVASIGAIKRGEVRHQKLEAILMAAHFVIFFGAVFWVLPVGQALAFIVVYHALVGAYLGLGFAPNHKGMAVVEGEPGSWLERQVLTSRNLRPGPLVDFLYGGLNYQIEHHLFPTMPRNNFRHARPIVRDFCRIRNLAYTETGVVGAMRAITGHLEWASRSLRETPSGGAQATHG